MANHLDLEEQEQLDQLKYFWKQYGNLINGILIAVLLAVAGWNLYHYWQRSQTAQASALFDEVERVARSGDTVRLERVLGDMQSKYSSTPYAQHAALLSAKVYFDAGKLESAKAALNWVADKSSDKGLQGIARLRLAGMLLDAKAYDEALKQLSESFAPELTALVADRRGDVLLAQGKKTEAGVEYLKAFNGLDEGNEYRRLIDVKLAALGLQSGAAKSDAAGVKK
jgi:predicted negative regulator of RcsB-dependent stress response